jgi:TP901 family phage tail tape measure protein
MSSGKNTGGSPKIDLRLSGQSQADLKEFLNLMERVKKTVDATANSFKTVSGSIGQNATMLQGMQTDMKQFKLLVDSMKRNAIVTQGAGGVAKGEQFRAERRAAGTSRLGSEMGQRIELQRESIALAKKGLSYAQQQARLEQAINLKLGMKSATIKRITDLDKARSLMQAAEVRKGLEIAAGESRRSESAKRIYDVAKARVIVLEQEARVAQKLARAEESRADRLARLKKRDPAMDRAEGAAARRKTLSRVNGDGGAGLFAIQASIMANYVAMNAARSVVVDSVQFAGDLDESLRNLQAITVVTDENLGKLKGTILEVSEETKFFATDIANAAVTLGQAGFSTKEIEDSIRAVALLATATGTELSKAVDLTTSILGVFNMESSQMAGVADTLTAAVNNSKLNIDKLTLGLQYAGNTAAQSGVSFEELTASLGAMANAGIRSGSTLGTGMRQILISLQKPSGEFQSTLARLGITMEEVDLRSQGLYGVLQNLKDGGFTAADAIRSFQVRAASAFNALAGNLGEVVKLERAFLNSSAAAKANETQMRAVTNQGRRLQANLQAVISTGLEPLVYAVRDAFSAVADWLQQLRESEGLLRLVVTSVVAFGASFLLVRTGWMAMNLIGMISGLGNLVAAIRTAGSAMAVLRIGMGFMMGPIGLITLALGAGTIAYGSYRRELDKAKTATAKAQTVFDNSTGNMQAMASQIDMVTGRMKELTDRSDALTRNQDLLELETEKVREQFREMGIELGENVGSVDELIQALAVLRTELSKKYEISIGATAESLELLRTANSQRADKIRGRIDTSDRTTNGLFRASNNTRETAVFAGVADPTKTLDELHALKAEAEAIIASYEAAAGVLGGKTTTNLYEELKAAAESAQILIDIKSQDIALERQLSDIQRSREVEQNRQANPGIVNRAETLGMSARSQTLASVQGLDDPVERFKAAKGEVDRIQAEALALKTEIEANTSLLPEVRQSLLQNIKNNLAEVEIILGDIAGTAQAAAKSRLEIEQMEFETTDGVAARQMANSQNPASVQSLASQRQGLLTDRRASEISELNSRFNDDGSSDAYAAALAKIEAQFDEDNEALAKETADILKGIADKVREAKAKGIEVLQMQLETEASSLAREIGTSNNAPTVQALSGQLDQNMENQKNKQIAALVNQFDGDQSSADFQAQLARIEEEFKSGAADRERRTASRLEAIAKLSQEAAKRSIEVQQLELETVGDALLRGLSDSEDRGEIGVLGGQLQDNLQEKFKAEVEALKNKFAGDTGDAGFQAEMAELEANYQVQQEELTQTISKSLSRIVDLQIRGLDLRERELVAALSEATNRSERDAIREQLQAVAQEQADLMEEQANLTIEGAEALALARQEIRQTEAETLAGIVNDMEGDAIAEAELALQTAQTAYDETLALARYATEKAQLVEIMKKKIAALANLARAARNLAKVKTENGDGTGPENDEIAETDIAVNTLKGDRTFATATKRLNRKPRKSGGGGSKGGNPNVRKKDEIDKLIDDLGNKLDVAENYLNAGQEISGEYDTVMDDALKKVESIAGQIDTLQSKLKAGGLSVQEQTKLNTLIDQQARMTSFIAEEEMRIALLKLKQGKLAEGALLTVRAWVRENLSLSNTLQDGIVSGLESAKSSLAEFFTSWTDGTKSGKEAFKDLAVGVIKSIQQIFAEMLAVQLLQKALGWINNTFGLALPIPAKDGGAVKSAAAGDYVKGNLSRDSQNYKLMPGEYVLRKSAVQAIGKENLDQANAMGNRAVATSNHTGTMAPASNSTQLPGQENTTNIYLVDERSQAGQMGPNDVIAIISDDMARGGATKKLIKSIQTGQV